MSASSFEESANFIQNLDKNDDFWNDGKILALLLDYDGTLSPIVSHPDLAVMTPETRTALEAIVPNKRVFTAIISGRAVDDVKKKVGIDGITYAGNHGFEIRFPDGSSYQHRLPEEQERNFEKIVQELETISKNGAWVENKKFSLTFHYREMAEELREGVRLKAKEIVERHHFRANQAHMAIEAKPPLEWNKGYAALHILKHKFGDNWETKANALFMGDDTTDEDVMKAIKGKGISFRITNDPNLLTAADFRIPSTTNVTEVLQKIQNRLSVA